MEAYYAFNDGKCAPMVDAGRINVKFRWCRFIKSVIVIDFRGV